VNLWNHIVHHQMVTGQNEKNIRDLVGGHPGDAEVLASDGKRAAVHAYLSARLPAQTARAA
jgi:hypothetical protein